MVRKFSVYCLNLLKSVQDEKEKLMYVGSLRNKGSVTVLGGQPGDYRPVTLLQ